jgi:hypothetical protein
MRYTNNVTAHFPACHHHIPSAQIIGLVVVGYGALDFGLASEKEEIKERLKMHNRSFVDLTDMASKWMNLLSYFGANFFIFGLQIMTRLSMSKKMLIIILTLREAAQEILAFFIFVSIYTLAFAFCTNILYGEYLIGYHNVPSSISTLVKACMGTFNYNELAAVRPDTSPYIAGLYVAVMLFIVLNVFIAILSKYFAIVSDKSHEEEALIQKELVSFADVIKSTRLLINSCFWSNKYEVSDEAFDAKAAQVGLTFFLFYLFYDKKCHKLTCIHYPM